jgi:AhpD family alkylhydroperoxidase
MLQKKQFVPTVGYQLPLSSSRNDKANHLGAKMRELIALAVAVTARCDGCIATQVDAALKEGATLEKIAEALGVAISLNAGAALVYSLRHLDAVEQKATERDATSSGQGEN